MFDVVYVAPHPDDVAFSVAAHLKREVDRGRRVAVFTLFRAETGPRWAGDPERRAEEDATFARWSGATLLPPRWPDAVDRSPRYRRARHRLALLSDDEQPLIDEVAAALQELVAAGCRRLVAPLAVGEHVDHQIAHRAACAVDGAVVWFYEDCPYALVPHQLPRRLARLGGAVARDDPSLRRASSLREAWAVARSWTRTPLFHEHVPALLRPFAAATLAWPTLRQRPQGSPPRPLTMRLLADEEVAPERLGAIACYDSQWRLFFPTLADWGAALAAYGHDLGAPSTVERLWRFVAADVGPADRGGGGDLSAAAEAW